MFLLWNEKVARSYRQFSYQEKGSCELSQQLPTAISRRSARSSAAKWVGSSSGGCCRGQPACTCGWNRRLRGESR